MVAKRHEIEGDPIVVGSDGVEYLFPGDHTYAVENGVLVVRDATGWEVVTFGPSGWLRLLHTKAKFISEDGKPEKKQAQVKRIR